MSISTHSRPRHRTPSPPLSRSSWRRLRLTLTAGVLVAATVSGVVVGLQGAAVSPVALPTPVAAAAPAPTVQDARASFPHDHGSRARSVDTGPAS